MGGYNERPSLEGIFGEIRERISTVERTVRWTPDWIAPNLFAGFSNVNNGTPFPAFQEAPVGYYRDLVGRVYLRGRVATTFENPVNEIIFTLANEYRPAYIHNFVVVNGGDFETGPVWANVTVHPLGSVSVTGQQVETFPLDQISFRTF